MIMTTDNTVLLRKSWSAAMVDKEALAKHFYTTLFELAPQTEALFKSDLGEQGKKLVATLAFIIDSLDDEEALLSAARDLAIRHVAYDVSADQYALVGQALISTFRELLGDAFDQEAERAWGETYTALADHMISSAYPVPEVSGS